MPTLMAVHAHPDDEATSTGGVLARYADQGVTTVVVTCTNGEYGDLPGGIKPDQDEHDPDAVVRIRTAELEEACRILDVTHLERLGYRDSGMADWEYQEHPDAFCNVSLDDGAARIIELFERYRPDVVITYNEQGGYNHPDHIQASLITAEAAERTQIPSKFYLTASKRDRFARIRELLEEAGVEMPPRRDPPEDWVKRTIEQEARITTSVDVTPYIEQKLTALRAHVSQVGESHWSRLPVEALSEVFGHEHFIRTVDASGAEAPEDDLFAGIS